MLVEAMYLLVALVALAVFVWWISMLFEALKAPQSVWERSDRSQLVFVLVMVLVPVVGAIAYMAIARPTLKDAARIEPPTT